MFCGKCGCEIIEGSGFCHKCGKAVNIQPPPPKNIPQAPPVNAAYSNIPQPRAYSNVQPPRRPKPDGLAKTILNLIARGVSIALLLIVFICSFFTSYKMDLGDFDPILRGIEIRQTSLQILSAAFTKYDEGECEDVYETYMEDIESFATEIGASSSASGFSTENKKALSKILSRYNFLKLAVSEQAIEANEDGLPAPKEARYTFGIYAAAILGLMIISFAALALFVTDLILYVLSLFGGNKKKRNTLFWNLGLIGSLAAMLFAALAVMFVPQGIHADWYFLITAKAGGAVILPLIFCPIIFIFAYTIMAIFEYKTFNVKRFVLQAVSLFMAVITISVFVNSSTVNVKAAYGESGKRNYTIMTTPYDFTAIIDVVEDYVYKDIIKDIPNDLTYSTSASREMFSAADLLFDEAYFNTYEDFIAYYKALNYIYIVTCLAALAFIGLTASSMLFNKASKLNNLPLLFMFLGFAGFLVGSILMKVSLAETFTHIGMTKSLKASIGGGPIAAMILSLFAAGQFFILERKPRLETPQPQIINLQFQQEQAAQHDEPQQRAEENDASETVQFLGLFKD